MKHVIAAGLVVALTGCAAPDVKQYSAEKPTLELQNYLNGAVDGWGMFQGRSGEVKKRFHVRIDAHWEGTTGFLDEHFEWSDGAQTRRQWTLKIQPDGTIRGTANDVVGQATGELAGNALHWRYVMELPVDGTTYHVDFDDWMYLMSDKVMLNRSTMSKWGFDLGEVTLTFNKL